MESNLRFFINLEEYKLADDQPQNDVHIKSFPENQKKKVPLNRWEIKAKKDANSFIILERYNSSASWDFCARRPSVEDFLSAVAITSVPRAFYSKRL